MIREEVAHASSANGRIPRSRDGELSQFVRTEADEMRARRGFASKDQLVDAAMSIAMRVWNAFNQPQGRRGHEHLSQAEVRKIAKHDPSLGLLTRAAYEKAQNTARELEAARTFGDAYVDPSDR